MNRMSLTGSIPNSFLSRQTSLPFSSFLLSRETSLIFNWIFMSRNALFDIHSILFSNVWLFTQQHIEKSLLSEESVNKWSSNKQYEPIKSIVRSIHKSWEINQWKVKKFWISVRFCVYIRPRAARSPRPTQRTHSPSCPVFNSPTLDICHKIEGVLFVGYRWRRTWPGVDGAGTGRFGKAAPLEFAGSVAKPR